jgi:hypothetical protein
MKPFFVTVAYNLHLAILPETELRMDGHPIITYSYSIFKRVKSALNIKPAAAEIRRLFKKNGNPDYLGHINCEVPGTVFNYITDGEDTLTRREIEQVIDEINRYRDSPATWDI